MRLVTAEVAIPPAAAAVVCCSKVTKKSLTPTEMTAG
jgi:hypothetical protein